MSRWLSNFLRGRTLESRAELTKSELEKLVTKHESSHGTVEIPINGMTIISAQSPLRELYDQVRAESEPRTTLTAQYEAYTGIYGKAKHYLDITMQTEDSTRVAKIIYTTKSEV